MFFFKWYDSKLDMWQEISAYNAVGANTIYGILFNNKCAYGLKCLHDGKEVIFVNGKMMFV